jgi:septum formation protein
MAPTAQSRPSGRSRCSSASAGERLSAGLVLASGSPQRRAILEQLGIGFEVDVPDVEELELGPPDEVALENAFRKAQAVAARHPGDALILAVDTVVALGSRLYGKPAGAQDAEATLRALSGRRHAVVSGLCLIQAGRDRTAAATTLVDFRPLDQRMIEWYLETEEWRGRAGAYAIQGRGAALIDRIEGDYSGVVGLPVATLLALASGLLWN